MAEEHVKTSPEYAKLPAGTIVKFGKPGDTVEEMRPLINCKTLGSTGLSGSFIDCTVLLDKNKQFISDLPEGPEKSLGFVDDPENEDFMAFLNAAQNMETVQLYFELPNKRTATMVLSLSGWEMNEISAPATEVIQITVKGKQNNLTWGIDKGENPDPNPK
ncbi:phage tail protein [Arsenophonus nasoniae]|uniref:phage tail protein n=1 Tax=Arsenophonus nasoniae TaxID=638 RepID=UPI00387A4C4B